jgi:hypothetical protein
MRLRLFANSSPEGISGDRVMFLAGSVATDDGTHLPDNVIVERVCGAQVRQQVYASSQGDFSMELGSMADSTLDASADGNVRVGAQNKVSEFGIPRRALVNCEMRASASVLVQDSVWWHLLNRWQDGRRGGR